jgi:transitional endoplasmic reticulum ATPase
MSSQATTKKPKHINFVKDGVTMIIPEKMNWDEAIEALQRKKREDDQVISLKEHVDAFPLDGAYMLMKVLKDRYGWASPAPTPGFFGDNPPVMMSMEIGFEEHAQVIWGGFKMPGIDGQFETGFSQKDGRFTFVISGTTRKKFEKEVKAVADEVRRRIKEESIYKGKAIRLHTDEDGDIVAGRWPSFLDLSRVKEEELVLPAEIEQQVRTSLFTPVERTEQCLKLGIPMKRGVLLEGPYGTGKTLTAFVTAKKCAQNNWTFIYIDRVQALQSALEFAKMYQPAVVFAEDIDRAISGDERTTSIDDILNTIDGIQAKGTALMTILTTNHVDKLNRAMLRPGRLDAVISIQPPDKEATEKLIRLYGRGTISADTDVSSAAAILAGNIPAVIREAVERAKLYAVSRMDVSIESSEQLQLTNLDLLGAAKEMDGHLRLMKPRPDVELLPEHRIGDAMAMVIEGRMRQVVATMQADS